MARFVRKNSLVCSGTFTAVDGSGATPLNAELIIVYPTTVATLTTPSTTATATIGLSVTGGVWSGVWDSSVAVAGRVDWMVHCWNGLVAADQGSFELIANRANTE